MLTGRLNRSSAKDLFHETFLLSRINFLRTHFVLRIHENIVFRTGSGAYSCVAENEGGMAEGNATIVITESITYIGKARVTHNFHQELK